MKLKKYLTYFLPFGLVRLLCIKPKIKQSFDKINISIGNSVLLETFSIRKDVPRDDLLVKIGNNSLLGCNIIFESDKGKVLIGDRVYIGASTIICRSEIEFENDILVAWGCYFYDHDSHSTNYKERCTDLESYLKDYRLGKSFNENKNWSVVKSKPIKICSNAWIGMNCIILKGVTIGRGAIVGAGSVVTKDVPPWTVVAGNPAKAVKHLSDSEE
jgi:acetyltransferase-like isoleucine patch superfamily enzyme